MPMAHSHIRKGDQVKVMAGKDRGKEGKVLRLFPREKRALVERVMMVKRHTRPNPQRQIKGGIAEHEAPIAVSNLMLICPECGPTRVGHTATAEGKRVRFCRKCNRNFE
jgi:large subunit ribosomal protein L24